MDNFCSSISSYWYFLMRVRVFTSHTVCMRSTVFKKNPKLVLNHACKANYMLKRVFFGLMDIIGGSFSSYCYFKWKVMVFPNNSICMSTVSKNNPTHVVYHAHRAIYMLKRRLLGLIDIIRCPII